MSSNAFIWKSLTVTTSKGEWLLKDSSGEVNDGTICGILGPSGAGKSTMLSALGGAISSESGLSIQGHVGYYNSNRQVHERLCLQNGNIAWLEQKDNFFSMLTVQETLVLAAFLELPHLKEKNRMKHVQSTMDSLGLTPLKHRKIGDATIHKGLSGGEKRRLSLALELLSSPKLFIGDEPTSGLDSTLSEKVVKLIRKLVKQRNIPCLLSLHQPRSSVWRMLDSVILLAPGGRVCYMGPTTQAVPYFRTLGHECPSETNPAEFLLDLVSIDSEDKVQAIIDDKRIERLALLFAAKTRTSGVNGYLKDTENLKPFSDAPGMGTKVVSTRRFGSVVLRSWRQNIRNHHVNAIRLVVAAGTAFLFTGIFTSVKKGDFSSKSIPDRSAMLSFGVINMAMMTVMKTIDLFAKERPVVLREQQRDQYTSLEYLLAKVVAEIPLDAIFAVIFTTVLKAMTGARISWNLLTATFSLMTVTGASLGFAIGSFSPSTEVAMSAGVPLMVVFLTVGVITPGGVDTSEPTPLLVNVLKQFSPIAFAIRAVCIGEFQGMEFAQPETVDRNFVRKGVRFVRDFSRRGGLALVKNGDQVLEELGLGDETYQGAMTQLLLLTVLNLGISWIGLQLQRPGKRWIPAIVPRSLKVT